MAEKPRPVRGMKDLVGQDYAAYEHIVTSSFNIAKSYGYEGISTPILEFTNVFDRTLGETSDVVSKEIYNFADKGGENIALRPEFTAGVMRSVISNSLYQKLPLKLFSSGPLFRYDRPQAGRQRQFHQLNFEYLGAKGPESDVETIALAMKLLENLGIKEMVELEINSLGCMESRAKYQEMLVQYFGNHKAQLSEDSLRRLQNNPMRILDSKDLGDREIVKGAPNIEESYTQEAKDYFNNVLSLLDALGIKYTKNSHLVRGLDYYCHTAFEFTTDKLGAQSAIGGGGRYDALCKIMGGPELPAIGFAMGIERIMLLKQPQTKQERPVYILPIGDNNLLPALKLAETLRAASLVAILESQGKIGKRMQKANDHHACYTIFIGDEEAQSQQFKVKNLDSGSEELIHHEKLLDFLLSK